YFTKLVGASYGNPQLWRTDGTAAGTQLVLDVHTDIRAGIAIGDSLWIQTFLRTYPSDGTPAGTVEISDTPEFDTTPTVCAGHAFFTSSSMLWQLDASLNAQPVATFQGAPLWSACAAGRFYLLTVTPGVGYDLWTSDGSPDGTSLVRAFGAF